MIETGKGTTGQGQKVTGKRARKSIPLIVAWLLAFLFNPSLHASDSLLIQQISVIAPETPSDALVLDVLVRDGRIEDMGPSIELSGLGDIPVINGSGKFLFPGLIDSHTHLQGVPGMAWKHQQDYPEIAAEALAQIPLSYLYHGFTTLIDLNSTAQPIAQWNQHPLGPTAYFCGAAPVVDGYPMNFMLKRDRYKLMPYFLFDEPGGGSFPRGFSKDEHSPQAVTSRMKNDGAICVKTHYEKGWGRQRNLPVPSPELMQQLISAAQQQNMPVLLHANSQEAHDFGSTAGVDAFVHGPWNWADNRKTELTNDLRTILDRSLEKGIALQPTIQVLYGERDVFNSRYFLSDEKRAVVPRSLIRWYNSETGLHFRDQLRSNPGVFETLESRGWQALNGQAIARVGEATFHHARNKGLFLFGSDTPSDMTFANPPGLNGRMEMTNLVRAGVSLNQLLRAITIDNARFFGLDDELGTVEVGKQADLLILSENPAQSLQAFDSIEWLVVDGRLVQRDQLRADRQLPLAADEPFECSNCDAWNQPQEPFHIHGNTWYVGTAGLAAVLVTSEDGHILIDGALPQSAPLIDANIRALGFDTRDIRYILNSHTHYDHAGGINALQRYTQARVVASEAAAPVLSSGMPTAPDPQAGYAPSNAFPAVRNVQTIKDGGSIRMDRNRLYIHYTPGHTPGGSTWSWKSCEDDVCIDIVYADSMSAVSAEGFRFSEPLPELGNRTTAAVLSESLQRIEQLPCDILLSPHPMFFGMEEKRAAQLAGSSSNPYIDEGACIAYARQFGDWLEKRLAKENEPEE